MEVFSKNRWHHLYDSTRVNGDIPKVSGIYAFLTFNLYTKKTKVVYIGKSNDLSQRLKPWHPIEREKSPPEDCIFFCRIMPTKDHHEKEKQYIKRFCPLFNVQFNPKIKRQIIYSYE